MTTIQDFLPTRAQLHQARNATINAAAWVAVFAVVSCKLLALAFEFFCDRVLPLAHILTVHAQLAWQDYRVGRDEYHQWPIVVKAKDPRLAPKQPSPKGFKP